MLAAPGAALALQPPTILSAGINASDQLYVTWALGAGTTFDQAQFATAPALEPGVPSMFNLDNLLGPDCGDAEECPSEPAATSYTTTFTVPRDRRYFTMVSAAAGEERLASAVWVIDEAKPLIAGQPEIAEPPVNGELTTGLPVPGRPMAAPGVAPFAPPVVPAPSASISFSKLPRRIGEILRRGVRAQVTCGGPCVAVAQLMLNGKRLAAGRLPARGAGARPLVVRLKGAARKRLGSRPRARLRLAVTVTPAGGAAKRVSRSFLVQR